MTINAIVACDAMYGIGKNNDLPWPKNKEDMKWFKENTIGHVVVMGRRTWESIGSKKLPNRINYVVTRSRIEGKPDAIYYGEMGKVLQNIEMNNPYLKIWIIGGADIYRQALPYCQNLYLTQFPEIYECDTFLDPEQIKLFNKKLAEPIINECVFSVSGK